MPVLEGRKGEEDPPRHPTQEKGRTDKLKRNDEGHLRDAPTGVKNTCMLHGPVHSSIDFKFLKEYSEKHVPQQPFKEKEARYGGNKRGKTIKFERAAEEVNIMKLHDGPTPRNKKGKRQNNKPKSDQANAYPSEYGKNYGLDRINLGETAEDSENDSE